MKCIYCNSDCDMSVSDIIPWALTGAKIRRKFVCHKHNAFTNDMYEKKMISNLNLFRNLLGLEERSGAPVRFNANLTIGGQTFNATNITDRCSLFDNKKKLFTATTEGGSGKTLFGNRDKLLQIKGATKEKIKDVDLSDAVLTQSFNLSDLFISNEALHTVAKVAYEWHCAINNIEEYDISTYKNIVEYILDPSSADPLVEIVTDSYIWQILNSMSRTGSNLLYEYSDSDGNLYVIFDFWDVIIYKIKICKHAQTVMPHEINNLYLYHTDGSSEKMVFGIWGNQHVHSDCPSEGLTKVASLIKDRLEKLKARDLSFSFLKKNVDKIKPKVELYKKGNYSFEQIMDYGEEDRFLTILALEKLFDNQSEYNFCESFQSNLYRILNNSDRFIISEEMKNEILERYKKEDSEGIFATKLLDAISFFETIPS